MDSWIAGICSSGFSSGLGRLGRTANWFQLCNCHVYSFVSLPFFIVCPASSRHAAVICSDACTSTAGCTADDHLITACHPSHGHIIMIIVRERRSKSGQHRSHPQTVAKCWLGSSTTKKLLALKLWLYEHIMKKYSIHCNYLLNVISLSVLTTCSSQFKVKASWTNDKVFRSVQDSTDCCIGRQSSPATPLRDNLASSAMDGELSLCMLCGNTYQNWLMDPDTQLQMDSCLQLAWQSL